MFTPLLKDIFNGVVRHFATAAAGWLLTEGLIQHSQIDGVEGSIIFLGAIAWSAYQKFSSQPKAEDKK